MDDRGGRALVLIRSGRTEWDSAGRLQGATDLPVAEEGLSEVGRCLEAWLSDGGASPSVVFCGEDEGSRESAKLAGEAFGAKVKSLSGLSAMGMGLWEGLTVSDLEERHPTIFRQWREGPERVNVPEGEGLRVFLERAAGCVLRVVEKHGKKDVGLVLRPLEFSILDRVLGGAGLEELSEEEVAGGGCAVTSHPVDADLVRSFVQGMAVRA